LKRADISAYILKRKGEGVGPATINRDLDVLSAAINYAVRRWDWDIPNPTAGMSLKQPEGRLRWLKRAEVDLLIRLAEQELKTPHLGDFIRLAVNTGCRRGELLGLEWDRVDMQSETLRLDGTHTKNGKRRFVPLTEEARQALVNRARFRAEFCPGSLWVFSHKSGRGLRRCIMAFPACASGPGSRIFESMTFGTPAHPGL
jgi:integrase